MTQYVHIAKYTTHEGGNFLDAHPDFQQCKIILKKPNGRPNITLYTAIFDKQFDKRSQITLQSFIDTRGFRWDCINGWTGLVDVCGECLKSHNHCGTCTGEF